MTLEEIKNATVAGHYQGDSELWARLDEIILDDSQPLELRAAASHKIDEIIYGGDDQGEYQGLSDEERVNRHAKILRDFI